MVGDELFEYAKSVSSRADFVKFVQFLNEDHQQKATEWENKTLDQFLGGLSGFANDIDGYYMNMGESVDVEKVTWRMVAEMLLAATVYGN